MMSDDTLPDRLAARLSDSNLAIFLFHGVIRQQRHRVRNYTRKHLPADLFARCIQRIAREGRALSMNEVLEHCEARKPFPRKAFAVTFDDGFENNLSVAAPILADCDVPATIYVTSGFVEANGMSWIDRIEYAVEEAPAQQLEVEWADEVFPLGDADSRVAFLKAVRAYVKNDPRCDAEGFADALCARLGKPGAIASDDPLDLKMTWEQVRTAAQSGLLQIGGHGHTHAILSFLSPARLASEIDTCLDLLSSKAGIGPTHFSYPEGLEHCYSSDVIEALQARGVRCSPTAIDGTNTAGTSPFHLRRIMVA